jgi:hypothetical protein
MSINSNDSNDSNDSNETNDSKETNDLLEEIQVPEEFHKIINDFIGDILITFPEYSGIISRWNKGPLGSEVAFRHCLKVFPERFFDILYKNVEIFSKDSEVNTEFLPGIVFKQLWSYDISDKTRETIWKYLQLTLFAVIGSVNSSSALGETAKLFEAINEDELKTKLQETMENMSNLFNFPKTTDSKESNEKEGEEPSTNEDTNIPMPNADDIHKHIHEMMGGKLGKLAMELAEETASDLNLDMENATNANDVFQQLFKNPTKMMSMVKNIGGKLDEKIKSGELKESELMSEGLDLLNKMQSMPGMNNMQKMFSQMGIPGLGGKGGKMNMAAMEAQMNKNMKAAQMKERMKEKAASKATATSKATASKAATSSPSNNTNPVKPAYTEEELCKIFSAGEKAEKTPRGAKPPTKNDTKNETKNDTKNDTKNEPKNDTKNEPKEKEILEPVKKDKKDKKDKKKGK